MSQTTLFDVSAKPARIPVRISRREVAVPHGEKKRGKYWHERFESDLNEALPPEAREILLEILLDWPAPRVEAMRGLLNRWFQAQPLERDNFAESVGR